LVFTSTETESDFDFLKKVFVIDTGSTINATIMNPDFVHNVHKSETPVIMSTNAGVKRMDLDAEVKGFGTVKFDPTQMANIFGFSHMVEKYRITYDSEIEDAFFVHTNNGVVKFARCGRLYCFEPSQKFLTEVAQAKSCDDPNSSLQIETSHIVSSVAENRLGFTDRQFEHAKRARSLYHAAGCPTVVKFKQLLRQNIIQDCPVTVKDVNIAEKIFGPDIGSLKGKTTRKKPPVVRNDDIEIPPELLHQHDDLVYCMDIMFVNGMPMLTGIDKTIRYRGLVPLNSRTAEELYAGLDKFLRHYNKAGFRIRQIRCDQEFQKNMDAIKDNLDIDMDYPPKGDHVPEAERNNRTIAERIRSNLHNLPFRAIP